MPYSDRVLHFVRIGKSSSRSVLPPILIGIVRKEFQLPRPSPNPVDF